MTPYHGRSGPITPGLVPQSARERLAARIAAIQARSPEPVPEPVPQGPAATTVDQAEQVLAATLSVASTDHWVALANGSWVHRETGLVEDGPPF